MKSTFLELPVLGLVVVAVLFSFLSFDLSNLWIPLTSIMGIMSIQAFITKRRLSSMEERLKLLESQVGVAPG